MGMNDNEILKVLNEANEITPPKVDEALDTNHPDKSVSSFLKFLNKIRATKTYTLNDLMIYMEQIRIPFSKEAHIAFKKSKPVGQNIFSIQDFLDKYPKK